MNCVLFAKVNQVFSLKKKKTLKKYWKSQEILSVQERGIPEIFEDLNLRIIQC